MHDTYFWDAHSNVILYCVFPIKDVHHNVIFDVCIPNEKDVHQYEIFNRNDLT